MNTADFPLDTADFPPSVSPDDNLVPNTVSHGLDPIAGPILASRRDLIARSRDEKGGATMIQPVSEPVLMEPKPLAETPLAPTIAVICVRRPDLAHTLENEHDRHVVHAIEEIDRVRDEEDRLLPERIRRAASQNSAVDEAQTRIRDEQATALKPLQDLLVKCEEDLARAHDVVTKAFAAANGHYVSHSPSEAGLPAPKELPEDVVAAELHLPWPLAEKVFQLPAWLHWTFTIFVGLLVGVNLALVMHAVEADNLSHDPVVVLIAWMIGIVLAEIVWRALRARWYDVGHYFYVGEPRGRFWTALLVAVMVTAALLGADVATVQHGLLADAASQAALGGLSCRGDSGAALVVPEATALWFVSLIVTLGYMTFATAQGLAEGRNAAVRNRIRHYQTMDLRQKEAAFAERVTTRAARAALSDVITWQGKRDDVRERISEATKPFAKRLSSWEGQRLPGQAELTLQKAHRVHDARQDALKAQADFYYNLHKAIELCSLPLAGKRKASTGRQH